MQKALLIAEKPSLRREIEEVYKKHKSEIPYDITFMDQRGHLVTLMLPDEIDETQKNWCWENLPFIPEQSGGWQYKVIEEKKTGNFQTAKERFNAIGKELRSGNYDFVINAGDPDQEGELLIRLVLNQLNNKLPVKRFWTNDLTETKISDALKNLKDDDNDEMLVRLLDAAYGRQHSDYRFGMNISRAASLKLGVRAACGRVKTPILAIVCKREKEIEDFVPKTVYGVRALYSDDFSGQLFEQKSEEAQTDEDSGSEENAGIVWFESKEEAEKLISELSFNGEVVKYETKRQETYAPKLFKLATAQIAAGKYGYKSDRTLEIIQGLYEKGFLSYPRTDCEYLSSNEDFKGMLNAASSVPDLQQYINTIAPDIIGKVKATKKWVNDKALQNAGHSALVPTTKKPNFNELSNDEQTIYRLVCRQFVAIFLPALVQDKTCLIVDVDGHLFKSNGKTLVDPGYSVIFGTTFTDMQIPEYDEGDFIGVNDYEVAEKTSTCPKRFTDADIVAACENPIKFLEDQKLKALGKELKIGTPATRAGIISELIEKDKYLQLKKEGKVTYVVPTTDGMYIYESLKTCGICKVDMTGEWEIMLEKVRSGNMDLNTFEKQMIHDVNVMIEDIRILDIIPAKNNRQSSKRVIGKCPACDSEIISTDKGIFCAGYKDKGCKVGCSHVLLGANISDEDFLEMISEGREIVKSMKKDGKSWDQKLKYDSETKQIVFVKNVYTEEKTGYECPACGEALIDAGRLLKCGCGFTLWKSVCGKELTESDIADLFEKGHTRVFKGLVGKSGKKFDAALEWKPDMSGTQFKFPVKE